MAPACRPPTRHRLPAPVLAGLAALTLSLSALGPASAQKAPALVSVAELLADPAAWEGQEILIGPGQAQMLEEPYGAISDDAGNSVGFLAAQPLTDFTLCTLSGCHGLMMGTWTAKPDINDYVLEYAEFLPPDP